MPIHLFVLIFIYLIFTFTKTYICIHISIYVYISTDEWHFECQEVPGLKSEQFATTPPRAVTTEERPRPRKMSRSFTTEREK